MKTITKQKTHTTNYNVYVANDGTEFDNESACVNYETSAMGVMRYRISPLHVADVIEYDLFDSAGSEEYEYHTYKANSETDKQKLLQYLILGSYDSDYYKKNIDKLNHDLTVSNFDEIYIFGNSLDDKYHPVYWGTVNNKLNQLRKLLTKKGVSNA